MVAVERGSFGMLYVSAKVEVAINESKELRAGGQGI